jgi:hypothetical protein
MQNDGPTNSRRFFHSFPRPRKGEPKEATLDRALNILALIKRTGMILAPEVVTWDMSVLGEGAKPVHLLQRRASFTELDITELPAHSAIFGPVSLACDIGALRRIGAVPVIYVPQGNTDGSVSLLATFCVNAVYHTKYVLSHLNELKNLADPEKVERSFNKSISPTCELQLRNVDAAGQAVAEYKMPLNQVRDFLQYVGFNNIPFDYSVAALSYYLNIFYPTDNPYENDQLGYYRQREWRFISSEIEIKNRPIARRLSPEEMADLEKADPVFWTRELTVDGAQQRRSALALVYDPEPGWNLFDVVEKVIGPKGTVDQIRTIVGDGVPVESLE